MANRIIKWKDRNNSNEEYIGGKIMKKFICTVCGYIHEGSEPPEICPICKVDSSKFEEIKGDLQWADEHRIGIAKDL